MRGEVERLELKRGQEIITAALVFRSADAFRRADHLDIAWGEHLHNALVEAEVAYRILNLSVLYILDTVARQSCQRERAQVGRSDIKEAAD